MKILNRFYQGIFNLATGISVAALIAIVLMIVAVVITRYVFSYSLRNFDEIVGYLVVVIVYGGAAYTQRRDMHIRVPIVVDELPDGIRKGFEIATEIAALIFVLVVFIWLTFSVSFQSYQVGNISNSSLETPMWIPQMIVPLGSAIFAVEIIRQIILLITKRNQGKTTS